MIPSVLKVTTGLIVAAIVAFMSYRTYDISSGRKAVEEMCNLDGGLRVNRTVQAAGYLDATNTIGGVTALVDPLVQQGYEYIDFSSEGPRTRGLPVFKEPGYFRGSIRDSSDESCIFDGKDKIPEGFGRLKVPEGKCLAVVRLPTRPTGYVYSQEFHRAPSRAGPILGVIEQVIKNEETGEIMAVNRDYLFASKTTYWMEFSGGGVGADAKCASAQEYRVRRQRFIAKVLRESKQKNP